MLAEALENRGEKKTHCLIIKKLEGRIVCSINLFTIWTAFLLVREVSGLSSKNNYKKCAKT